MKYELGRFDVFARAHGDSLIEEMKALFPPKDVGKGAYHSVVVCVYADGFLQFAGGNAGWLSQGDDLNRKMVKEQACRILPRMGILGPVEKMEVRK